MPLGPLNFKKFEGPVLNCRGHLDRPYCCLVSFIVFDSSRRSPTPSALLLRSRVVD